MTKEKTPESLKNVMTTHMIFGEYLYLENKYEEARKKYSFASSNYRLLKDVRNEELEKLYLKVEEKIADAYYSNKQYKESLEKYQSLIEEYSKKNDFNKLSILCSKAIDICMDMNDILTMRMYAELSIQCFKYADDNTKPEIVIRYNDSIYGLGKVFYLEGDFIKAIELFEQSKLGYVEIYSKLYGSNNLVNSVNKIITVNYNIADSYVKLGNYKAALDTYDKIMKTYITMYKEDFEKTNEYIEFNYKMAKAYISMKEYHKVIEHSENVIKYEKELLPNLIKNPVFFIELYMNNSFAYLNLDNINKFNENYIKTNTILKNEEKRGKIDVSKHLTMLKHILGLYYWKNNNPKALDFYYSALRDSKMAYEKDPGNRTSCDLVFHHYSLAKYMKETNDERRYPIYEIIYAGSNKLQNELNQYDTLTYIIESCLELLTIEQSNERRKSIVEFAIFMCEKIMKVVNNDYISNKYNELKNLIIN
jgi:tetratricopeptide (TPR) repeat protein